MAKKSFGVAEFKVVCSPTQVKLVIQNNHVVARCNKDIYEEVFKLVVKKLGGSIRNEKDFF